MKKLLVLFLILVSLAASAATISIQVAPITSIAVKPDTIEIKAATVSAFLSEAKMPK